MLEEVSVMEKKPNGRSCQPPAKAGTEGKKNTEAVIFGKNNRRREPSNLNSNKNEPYRKVNNPAKQGRHSDKRPRPRNHHYAGGSQETKVEDIGRDPEYGSVLAHGRKKQNLNHLLNFTLAPRPAVGSGSSLRAPERPAHWLATHKHKYNKEQFLQANCQFIVKNDGDYTVHLVDPDVLVDWVHIEQIRLRSTELLACPICLDTPVAAKMTRCGHVYCWSCILHYLALSDKTWRKCPICYESVHKGDLKSVVTFENTACRVGEEFTFKLMKRERGTLLAVPVEEDDALRQASFPLSVSEPILNTTYSKLLLATPSDVQNVVHLERIELEAALKAAQDEPEVCFIEQALELLREREKELEKKTKRNSEGLKEKINEIETVREVVGAFIPLVEDPFDDIDSAVDEKEEQLDAVEMMQESGQIEESSDEDLPNVSPEDVETESQVSGLKPFYFYQASDGQNVFLTALNLRMLETQYGSLANAPLTITGPVLEKESGSMTRELRNRLRSLSHLPITAAFELLELDMSGWVSSDVFSAFAKPLNARAERRRKRERDERRRERRITQATGLQWGQKLTPRIHLDSAKHFPRCGEEETALFEQTTPSGSLAGSCSNSLSSLGSTEMDAADAVEALVIPPRVSSLSMSPPSEHAGPSFAQMLKVGVRTNGPRKQACGRPAAPEVQGRGGSDDECLAAPRYQQSFSEAIALALERVDLKASTGENSKKKKKKQKLLFSSGMTFAAK